MDARPSHVVELFLPTASNGGEPIDRALFDQVRDELLERFGGVTLFTRSPADGLWAPDGPGEGGRAPDADRMITVEVMTETVDAAWWADYRRTLERRFGQEELLVRCYDVRRL
jgi:hypothetical protein